MKLYESFSNILDSNLVFSTFEDLKTNTGWQFTGYSSDEGYTFWYKNLMSNEFYTKQFHSKIEEITGRKWKVNHVYANGQTHGLSGSLHIDDQNPNAYTFLYYANPVWDILWGGNTVFTQFGGETQEYVIKPNTAILFKGDILHAGLEPTRYCKELRITIAFKMELLV